MPLPPELQDLDDETTVVYMRGLDLDTWCRRYLESGLHLEDWCRCLVWRERLRQEYITENE